MNETIYVSKKNEEILNEVPGDNVSQKIAYLIGQYKNVQGEQ